MAMRGRPADAAPRDETVIETMHRAFEEFLALPTMVIGGFVLLAVLTWYVDTRTSSGGDPIRQFLSTHLFGRAETTANLLGAVAAGLFTVTSIIISLLIVAIQASAASMSTAIFDQFLRRRQNQLYFGFFVGVALFSLLTLATTHEQFNPVYGGMTCVVLAVASLYLLMLLLYTTVNQMRPQVVIGAIQQHAARARERQNDLLRRTSRGDTGDAGDADGTHGTHGTHGTRDTERADEASDDGGQRVISRNEGYVVAIDIDQIERGLQANPRACVHLRVAIGAFVSECDLVAVIEGEVDDALCGAVLGAIRVAHQRDIAIDAAFALEQIETIGWTAISSAKSNPQPGRVAMRAVRELLARWSRDQVHVEEARNKATSRISYPDDPYGALFDAFETFAAAAAEAKQPQTLADLLAAISEAYDSVPESWRPRLDQVVLRVVPTADEQLPSVRIESALRGLARKLRGAEREAPRRAASRALARLEERIAG